MVVNYVKNKKGTTLISYKGFVYTLNRRYSTGKLCWRCTEYKKRKCTSRVHVLEDEIIYESDNHNHEVPEDKSGLVECGDELDSFNQQALEDKSSLMECEDESDSQNRQVLEDKLGSGECEDESNSHNVLEDESGMVECGGKSAKMLEVVEPEDPLDNTQGSDCDDNRNDVKDIMDEQPTKDFPMAEGDEEDDDGSNVLQAPKSHESIIPQHSYIIKPSLEDKFKAYPIRDIIQQTLNATLGGKAYDSDNAKQWTISIANTVNQNIKDLHMKRYKHIVQVTIGELKGAGVKSGLRCLWDSETDGYTSEIFMNDTIFAVVVVFAVYLY